MNVNDCICELMFISEKCFPIDPEIASEDLNTDNPFDTTAIDGYRADDLQRTLNNTIDLLRFLRKMYPDISVDHSEGMLMTLDDLYEKLSGMPGDTYIVRIAAWYDFEPKPHQGELFNEILEWNGSEYIWENDWYEGQQNIKILGFISLQDVNVPCLGGENNDKD